MTDEKSTAEKLSDLIEQKDLDSVARLLGFIPENIDKAELIDKVNDSLKSYAVDGHFLQFPYTQA